MKPAVQPLAHWHRKLIFTLLLVSFLVALPVFMFYATGYRYDFFSDKPVITATGGLYIAAEAEESSIYVDQIEITNARIFRNASYIQGLVPGLRRVHVQSPGTHTWVKQLSIYPHIVTEADAFNLPLVPQVRPITMYITSAGEAVFRVSTTSEIVLPNASSTVSIFLSTTTATSSFKLNQEYELLSDLFEEKASTTALIKKAKLANVSGFTFASSSNATNTAVILATTTVTQGDMSLIESGDELLAVALGTGRQIPHYFCTTQIEQGGELESETSEGLNKGEIAFEDTLIELSNNTRECRTQIKIDRQGEKILGFSFLPGDEDLVLVLRTSGLYVTEIDDRVWQNTQPLYLAENLDFIIYNGGIYVKDGKSILEVLTEIGDQI